jgi:hypothetical protein
MQELFNIKQIFQRKLSKLKTLNLKKNWGVFHGILMESCLNNE